MHPKGAEVSRSLRDLRQNVFMHQLTNTKQRDAVVSRMALRQSGLASVDVLVFGTTIALVSVCIAFAVHISTVLAFLIR